MICENTDQSPIGIVLYTGIDHLSRVLSISGSVYRHRRSPDNNERLFHCGLDFAFEILNMHRVEAEVLESNLPAQQLDIGKLGFKIEGIKRQSVYKAGRYYNSLFLGLLREEWNPEKETKNQNFDHDKAQLWIEQSREVFPRYFPEGVK